MTAVDLAPDPPRAAANDRGPAHRWWLAPLAAAVLAAVGTILGWRGTDLPAQLYRVDLFRRVGLTLWDSQWYGGHWTLDYSVIFPPVAGVLGVQLTVALSATGAAWAFDRLVIGHFGHRARVGSLLFALGTTVQVAIGQLPFLMGEALALGACWAAARAKWPLAVGLALATSLASPLAGAFLALATLAWLLAEWPRRRLGLAALVAGVMVPVGVVAVMFPGQGNFPYPFGDFIFELPAAVIAWLLIPRRERALRMAVGLYVLASAASFVLPTPIGGNVGRLGECFAIPIAACVLWPMRRWLLVVVAVPMTLWQWTPAWGAIADHNSRQPSTHQAYYEPLVSFLRAHATPLGRVEVVPTQFHWEAAYVAPSVAIARGWERQLDIADNGLFYDKHGLNPVDYESWLIDNGVRYVALPDAPLDFAGTAEAALVTAGMSVLEPVWSNANWRVFEVRGANGIVDGPAQLVSIDGGRVVLNASGPGTVVVRVRYSPHWRVTTGTACIRPAPGRWMALDTIGPETIQLDIRWAATAQPSTCAA